MAVERLDSQFLRIDLGSQAYALQFFTPGVNDHTYLVVSDGEAALIDPQRDYGRFLDAADSTGARLAAVFETHIHNDYVSGGALAARERNARYVLPADCGAKMPHVEIGDGESISVGSCLIRALHTPGHTPHHTSYVLEHDSAPLAAFSGGSMLVAGVGRTDLISKDLAEPLARDQFKSVRRIADRVDDQSPVGPTHGAGSFCGSAQTGETYTTVEKERQRNPALLTDDEDRFVKELLASYRLYPNYYKHMGPVNVIGAVAPTLRLPKEVTPAQLEAMAHDHAIVDVRPAGKFAAKHIPGSINIPEVASVAVYAGWALDWDQDFVLVTQDEEQAKAAVTSFARTGIDRLNGAMTDGISVWRSERRTTSSYRVADFAEMSAERPAIVLDVRDPAEFAISNIPEAINIHFSELRKMMSEIPEGEVWVHCESGFRAAIAASLLSCAGRDVVLVDDNIANSELLRAAS